MFRAVMHVYCVFSLKSLAVGAQPFGSGDLVLYTQCSYCIFKEKRPINLKSTLNCMGAMSDKWESNRTV